MSELTKEMPKKLGFGCMRLPVTDGSTENINDAAFCEMSIPTSNRDLSTLTPHIHITMADPRKQSDAVWYNGMRGIIFSLRARCRYGWSKSTLTTESISRNS